MYAFNGRSTGVYNNGATIFQLKEHIQEKIHVPVIFQSIIRGDVTLEDCESSLTMLPLFLVISHERFIARMANSRPYAAYAQHEALRSVIDWANIDPECAESALSSCYDWYILPYTIRFLRMDPGYHSTDTRRPSFEMTINRAIAECQASGCHGFSFGLPENMGLQVRQRYRISECSMTIALYAMHEGICDEPVHVVFNQCDRNVGEILRTRGFDTYVDEANNYPIGCGSPATELPMLMYVVQHEVTFIRTRVHRLDLVYAAIRITSRRTGWEDQHFSSHDIQALVRLCPSKLSGMIVDKFGIPALEGNSTQPSHAEVIFHLSRLRSRDDVKFLAALKHLLGCHEFTLLNAVSFALRKFVPIGDKSVLQALRRCAEETTNASILKTLKIASPPDIPFWTRILGKAHIDRRTADQITGYVERLTE